MGRRTSKQRLIASVLGTLPLLSGCGARVAADEAPSYDAAPYEAASQDAYDGDAVSLEPDVVPIESGARDDSVETDAPAPFETEWVVTAHAKNFLTDVKVEESRYAQGLFVDAAGNTWMSGDPQGTSDWNAAPMHFPSFFVTKLDPAGKRIWSISTQGRLLAVTADGRGLLAPEEYAAIDWGTGSVEPDVLFAELDSDGAIARKVRYVGKPGAITVTAMCVTASDQVFVSGRYYGGVDLGGIATPADGSGAFLAVFDGARRVVRVTTWNGPPGWRVAADDSGAAYVAGGATGLVDFGGGPITAGRAGTSKSPTNYQSFLARYDADGKYQWSTLLPPIAAGTDFDRVSGLALHPAGGVVVASDEEMDRIDASGLELWRVATAGSSFRDEVMVDADGSILSTFATWSSSDRAWEFRLEHYSPLGDFVSSRELGEMQATMPASCLALDAAGGIRVSGVFFGELPLGSPPPAAPEKYGDFFVAKLKP